VASGLSPSGSGKGSPPSASRVVFSHSGSPSPQMRGESKS
jgi:hypothetical protein